MFRVSACDQTDRAYHTPVMRIDRSNPYARLPSWSGSVLTHCLSVHHALETTNMLV